MKILQIVPQLPPSINGLGDYAFNLANQLLLQSNVNTTFLVCDPKWEGTDSINEFKIKKLQKTEISTLLNEINQFQLILLHFVGYAYAKRGCPKWLVDGIKKWKSTNSKNKLITMFHEVYATSYFPWQSSFWLSYFQKELAKKLFILSDKSVTSNIEYANMLDSQDSFINEKIKILPVFSNVGESGEKNLLEQRNKQMVIFGGRKNRENTYLNSKNTLKEICKELNLNKVLDIGPELKIKNFTIPNIEISSLGVLSSNEISQTLSSSVVGCLHYDPRYLERSGIFAAYCAHGLLTFNSFRLSRHNSNRVIDSLYISFDKINDLNYDKAQFIANNANNWYNKHDLNKSAEIFNQLLYS